MVGGNLGRSCSHVLHCVCLERTSTVSEMSTPEVRLGLFDFALCPSACPTSRAKGVQMSKFTGATVTGYNLLRSNSHPFPQ